MSRQLFEISKRVFDIVFALLLLIITFPIWIIIYFLLRKEGHEVFFKQKRIGKNGKSFYIIKFRTMYPNANEKLNILLQDKDFREKWLLYRKLDVDPRITPVGKILRKYSLDELPQLINVIKGDMSFVGPRPVTYEEIKLYYKKKAKFYFSVRPGLTGLWQVESKEKGIPIPYRRRIALDLLYVKKRNWCLDLKIIVRTILAILKGKGI